MTRGRAALTVDLETFEQLPAYRDANGTTDRTDVGLEVLDDLLALLDRHGATCTFFTVASIAEDHSDLIAEIADRGHEIASHTRSHRHLPDLAPDERREEITESRSILEHAAGTDVSGFRAPSFQRTDDSLELLADAGYEYDSSVVAARSIGWYGGGPKLHDPCPATAVDPDAPADLRELPVSVMPGLRLPLTGAWLRLFGIHYALAGMMLQARQGRAPVLYVHPWELADLPDVEGVPRRVTVRTGDWTWRALERILQQDVEFVTARTLAMDGAASESPPQPNDVEGRS
ncbi:polysaccharide deacetylase [Salinarchaeum sp. Harcht-Bsk1]|uniref:polysaccharide deacetylase family protein n=1 Tax=Salinarchaeum sp. Harcht-Bsk1 TaxID=1333523 RepID=UPI0003423601|nr:polysaccharide deacetylase family protein [Salinarchaeum sp. Harcht-Bsk1]AGN00928.1 polysaccharide deacetylase [Salinarchaeum sp. Harcht-Bsk1]